MKLTSTKNSELEHVKLHLLGNDVALLPSVAHLENELLPQMRNSSRSAVAVVNDTHARGKTSR